MVCMCREGGGGRRAWFKKSTCPKYSTNYNQITRIGKAKGREGKEIILWQRYRENGWSVICVIRV